ncbi:MAG TPA: gamma-glutamyltransferase [Verrucomicrobiae bacterium]|nr:gamma-glutamyltransferase [Verrucomicrobiae bacterium]
MPDIILTTLNAKYIHAAFGLRYLLANLGPLQARAALLEFDLQQRATDVVETILAQNPRIVGLGVYIWNVAQATEVAAALKRVRPDVILVLGGPEVSYEAAGQPIVETADYVITGEADLKFAEICQQLLQGERPAQKIIAADLPEPSRLALPYDLYDAKDIAHRVLYVEASRGCPFTCEFCLSSLDVPVRQFPLEPFLAEMQKLLDRGATQFKFVDRTFNLNLVTSKAILQFFLERYRPGLFVHFEMIPDRLPEALREIIAQFPPGALQFEVGVQTFDDAVSKNISRRQDYGRLADNLHFLRTGSGVHVHADLIVGLPGETVETFAAGFDRLVALGPQEIQVGILKRLRGTPIVRHDAAWQMVYSGHPPYEILQNKLIDFSMMQRLRRFARYWDLMANSGNFLETTPLLWAHGSPFAAFLEFSDWLHGRTGRTYQLALAHLAELLFRYLTEEKAHARAAVAQSLWRDWQRTGRHEKPPFLSEYISDAEVRLARPKKDAPRRQARHLVALFVAFVLLPWSCFAQSARGEHGAVATVSAIASRAGVEAMKNGGNAVDAAVASALTLGVVNGFNSGIGGGCFILIRTADGEFLAIDGRETAPAAATRDMFVRNGKGDPRLSQFGPLASGVPGELAACDLALRRAGKRTLREHLLAAAQIAEDGFALDHHYAEVLSNAAPELAKFPASAAVFLKPDGAPWREGEIFRQPALAKTYRAIAAHGLGWFYGGAFARATEKLMKANGGILAARDFKNYRAVLRDPISTEYRGCTVVSFPPPSSGGVHLLEMLNILETRSPSNPVLDSIDGRHFIAEAMKLAFADRAYWLGDPGFAQVPRGLIEKSYARALAAKINLEHTTPVLSHGMPPDANANIFSTHTTHISAADQQGNWVALTATINTHFGSKMVVPGTGVVLNNEMDDFSVQPGVTNYFGLVGAEANAVAPGKRPLSSMSPTIVLKGREPILSVGAAGGPTIINQTLLTVIDVLDLGRDAQSAISDPKFHQQWQPDELRVENKMDAAAIEGLRRKGHKIHLVTSLGAAQAVSRDPASGVFLGASDPRAGGQAAAW